MKYGNEYYRLWSGAEFMAYKRIGNDLPLTTKTIMRLHFEKYHGTGNDFIIIDDRARNFEPHQRAN